MSKKLFLLSSFVLVLGLTTTVANADIADGLVAYWPLDEGGGATTSDRSGNGNDGTLNLPGWDVGKFGGALNFDGVDDYVDCGNPSILDFGTSDFTVSVWIKTTNAAGETIFGNGGDNSGGIRVRLYVEGNPGVKILVDDDSSKYDPEGNIAVVDGQWHHIVGMRRGTALRVYIDGVEDQGATAHGESTIPAAYDLSGTSQHNAYIGAQASNAGGNLIKFFGGLIDDVALWSRALTLEEISYLWNGGAGNPVDVSGPGQASEPYPDDEEADVSRDVVLSWSPGDFAPAVNGHTVYLSENFNDVNDGIGGIAQDASSYDPGRLEFGTTYYWRVDEVNAPPDSTIFEGEVWSFTTELLAYPIQNIIATASSSEAVNGPESTVNGSGLDDSGLLHGKDADDNMWRSSATGPQPTWIEFQFDKVYKLHEMWVWNSNQSLESVLGFGIKDASIEYSVDGIDYTTLGTTHEFAQAPGMPDYAHNTTVDFSGVPAKYVRLTANSNWGGFLPQFGLSEVRFLQIPVHARNPYPDSGATDVDVDVVLGWAAGREAVTHDVYVSTDEQAVIDGTAPVATVAEAKYGPLSLDLSATHYWKINEVNDAETSSTWESNIWSFTTTEYLVVDDFESYNDLNPEDPASNRIFNVWIDGYEVATNGSIVGHDAAPFAERTIVHGGKQSMPLFFSNTVGAVNSEAERTFVVGQNWTQAGATTLALYFHGAEGNTGQLYVKVDGSKVVYGGDAGDIAKVEWKQWSIDLASLGVNLQNITKLSIGIDGNGATGTLYVDDIRLYRSAPEAN
jgi:hypothetical protein